MTIKQLSVFVENKPGRLATVTKCLAESGINVRAFSMADTTDFGILRLIVNRPEAGEQVLKEAGFTVSITSVLAVGLEDRPGALAFVLDLLRTGGVNVEYIYAFIGAVAGSAYVILRLDDEDRAQALFSENGVKMITAEAVYAN